jgi:flagellar hook-basal body complex protein FliE
MSEPLRINIDPLKQFTDKLAEQNEKKGTVPFGDILKGFMSEVNDLQVNMDKKIEQFAAGQTKDVHEVMIAVEEADVAFQLMMEIRNKLLKAFEEVMRMTV